VQNRFVLECKWLWAEITKRANNATENEKEKNHTHQAGNKYSKETWPKQFTE
jgi:hypothetical protein